MFEARLRIIGILAALLMTAMPSSLTAGGMPDSVVLDSLADLYEKVTFDHARHATIVENCADCHHHTTGAAGTDPNCARCHRNASVSGIVACRGCHEARPFSAASMRQQGKTAYHTDRLGLKGAYHQGCTGCHERMGGPTGCQDCHTRKKRGDVFFSAGAGGETKNKGKVQDGRH